VTRPPAILILLALLAGAACTTPAARAGRIHSEVLTIDSHVDTPMRLERMDFDIGQRHERRDRGGCVDLPRMREGGLDAIFFAVFLGQGERTPAGNERAKEHALRIFAAIHAAVQKNAAEAGLALCPDDAYRLERQGRRAIFLGIENGYPIGRDLSLVQRFFDLGARYITLCHSQNNDLCDSSTDEHGAEHHGLSPFGAQVVAEMNRLGMMVDVSHVSDETFYDVLARSRAPVIASHSCARALCDHARNLDDAMLRALAQHGGVLQVCIYGGYLRKQAPDAGREAALLALRQKYGAFDGLSQEQQQQALLEWEQIDLQYPEAHATVADLVDHIDHIVQVAGIDHVGIGTDFDGGGGIDGCADVSELGNITAELVRRGYGEEQIRRIWGGNLVRVMRAVQAAAGGRARG
jgi:membrane dipeptidase